MNFANHVDLIRKYYSLYFECSAKDNAGVEDAFFYLANEFHKLHAEQAGHMAQIA